MGWKENGKYGDSTGRTVRSPFANAGGPFSCSAPGREMEYLLKFTRGTETLSSTELDEFLSANDIDDGLGDFAESSMRRLTAGSNVHLSSISYSLKKRKRWRLPDLDRTGGLELKDSADRPNVTFIHRRVEKTLDADCFAIEKTKENEVFTPRKRKYTRVQDLLKRCDASEVEPEVGYEISYTDIQRTNILSVVKVMVIDIVGRFNGLSPIHANLDLRTRASKIRDTVGICTLTATSERKRLHARNPVYVK